ncbi:MAG: hypothetical protein HQL52_09440 [Magnetococcales bacterium]|nr:hypothetical protein [Magnetococcales bacterium]
MASIGVSLTNMYLSGSWISQETVGGGKAFNMAEAGMQAGLEQLWNSGCSPLTIPTEQTLNDSEGNQIGRFTLTISDRGSGLFDLTVVDTLSDNQRTISRNGVTCTADGGVAEGNLFTSGNPESWNGSHLMDVDYNVTFTEPCSGISCNVANMLCTGSSKNSTCLKDSGNTNLAAASDEEISFESTLVTTPPVGAWLLVEIRLPDDVKIVCGSGALEDVQDGGFDLGASASVYCYQMKVWPNCGGMGGSLVCLDSGATGANPAVTSYNPGEDEIILNLGTFDPATIDTFILRMLEMPTGGSLTLSEPYVGPVGSGGGGGLTLGAWQERF